MTTASGTRTGRRPIRCLRQSPYVTLAWLADRRDRLSSAIPNVIHFQREEDAEYLITSSVPGALLKDVWRGMPEDERRHLAGRIIEICEEPASTWASNAMSGVDGWRLFENWLNFCVGLPRTCEPDEDNIQNIRERLGMDYSKPFVFAHGGIGGGEVVIDSDGSIGLINWANAGYCPWGWARTKFACS
ncbi:hypothetical protein GGTG_04174 [Gaeumannomyces tritici R3-111a-1]|uniref:Aminoglycoside phosphotransferase domain-containing protein n=1 Tax=Gaeumannomyces tritici (strain R3-111a-1) TaxID=644352 RepID=J3NSC8_GAET3|nr:hypothetical protein GGTG_04174 [Gaeumannomyces tritici R3-111a-1]EJT79085.1 hypothetical protein GGTG_04174 [Gaeumannomyces tritici R3-111a-1]